MKNLNQREVAKSMRWLAIGLAIVSASALLPKIIHPSGWLTEGWFDGLRGLIAGIGIGLELMAVIRLRRLRNCRNRSQDITAV